MSVATTNGEWIGQVERQAARIRAQIASMTAYAQKAGGGVAEIERLCSPYYNSLEKLYREDFSLASAIENSDLLLRYEGRVLQMMPRLSLISSIFTSVRQRVGSVAYAISGLVEAAQHNKEVDLELSAYATGSLYLGFTLPNPANEEGNLIGENDPLYQATRQAIRTIGVVSGQLSAGANEEEVAREFPDALVRDTALAAVQGLAPSAKSKIDSVMLIGRDMPKKDFSTLTPDIRKSVRQWLKKPIESETTGEFIGVVREIDLDIQRFSLRRLVGTKIQEVRCAYSEEVASKASQAVDKQFSVIVSGKVHYDNFGNPKLMQVESIKRKDGEEVNPQNQLL
jgi:hypothetical protein